MDENDRFSLTLHEVDDLDAVCVEPGKPGPVARVRQADDYKKNLRGNERRDAAGTHQVFGISKGTRIVVENWRKRMGIEPTKSLFPNPSPVLKTGPGTSHGHAPER